MPSTELYDCTLGFQGLRIIVRCNTPAPVLWLQEFFLPHLRVQESFTALRHISVEVDESRYAQRLAELPADPQQQIDCFTMDGVFERHHLVQEGPGTTVIHNITAQYLLTIAPNGGAIQFLARADCSRVRVGLMRLARELAMIQAHYRGNLFLHGGAVVHQGRAVVMAGERRAGKTTMLINALRQPGTRFLSNDRVFVELSGNSPMALGMPTIIKIRPDCLTYLPGLSEPDRSHPYRHYLSAKECQEGSAIMEPPNQQPPSMSPIQFCRWLEVDPVASTPLAALVFPRLDATVEGFELSQLDSTQGRERLQANLFRSGGPNPIPQAFSQGWEGDPPSSERTLAACQALSNQCMFLMCRIGPNAFQSPNVWDAIASSACAIR